MKFHLPSFLAIEPSERFKKIERPFLYLVLVLGFAMRGWQFGGANWAKYNLIWGYGGLFMFEVILFLCFFALNGRNLAQLVRLQILYLAFVPNITFVYLRRVIQLPIAFEIRDDVAKGKVLATIALWYPEVAKLLQVVIPMIILLFMAFEMNKEREDAIKYPKWYVPFFIVAIVLVFLTLPFPNLGNLCMCVSRILFVCVIWDMWERVRKSETLEPMVMVSWAEMILFLALFLKGVVDNLGK